MSARLSALPCPFCGMRPLAEFVFRKTLANVEGSAIERLYLRHDSATESREDWQHVGGCRAWLRVTRNPSSGAVLQVELA